MCGIVTLKKTKGGKKNKGRASKAVLKRFHNQRSRGTQGFGYIAIENGKITNVVRAESETEIVRQLKQERANHIIFHHRLPTSTPNLEDMAHPIAVKNNLLKSDYYVVHNGVIRNPDELRTEHENLGFNYTTDMSVVKITKTRSGEKTKVEEDCFNDSEAFAIDLALYLDGVNHVFSSVGSIAFVCLETDKEGNVLKIHYGRNNGNPLVVEENKGILSIKSEGHGVEVGANILHTIDYNTNELTMNDVEIGELYKSYGYNRDENTKNIYNTRGYDFDNANEEDEDKKTELLLEENPIKSPYSTAGRKLIYNDEGQVTGSYDPNDESDFESIGDEGIEGVKKQCTNPQYTLENLQALIEEENDLMEEVKEAEKKIEEHESGENILCNEDILYEKTWKEECLTELINIRQEIALIEFELQDTEGYQEDLGLWRDSMRA